MALRRCLRAGGLSSALLLACLPVAQGTVFNIAPVRGDLGPGKNSEAFTVRNDSDEPLVIQTETLAWSQKDGQDELTPTRELLVAPPIFTVPPHAEQIVRAGLRRPPDARRELSYRLLLKETPGPPKPDFQGVRMALQISVPVFVAPVSGEAQAALRWKVTESAPGQWRVRVDNSGQGHIRISELRLEVDGKTVATSPEPAYVLPEQGREWRLRSAGSSPPSRVRLQAVTDGSPVDETLAVEKP